MVTHFKDTIAPTIRNTFIWFIIGLVLLIPLGFFFHIWASTPVVYRSYSTDECEYVTDPLDQGYSCENMPKRYEEKWRE